MIFWANWLSANDGLTIISVEIMPVICCQTLFSIVAL